MGEMIFRTIEVRKMKLKKPTHITKDMVVVYHGRLRCVTNVYVTPNNDVICVLDAKFEVYVTEILNFYNREFKLIHNHGIKTKDEVEEYINKINK
jgi:hypothetical protein